MPHREGKSAHVRDGHHVHVRGNPTVQGKAPAHGATGERIYQQVAEYTLMLNTGLRTGEVLGLLNSDIDLENRVIHLQRGVKEISKRNGVDAPAAER